MKNMFVWTAQTVLLLVLMVGVWRATVVILDALIWGGAW